jgi:hypothetical protein
MSGEWDANYNTNSVSPAQVAALEQAERERIWAEQSAIREARRTEFDVPWISDDVIRANFQHYATAEAPDRAWHQHVA